ncbi:putative esterase [Oceanicola granulosus HTCC2516]|uniref:Putative esterase n=1 Tax=Oceanicola granulosus (strain ATCC BAA-861 / DSM 15982 / KCTC 12143 / HTCC2516) TaxID=314256 RepID=Q2CC39_OCEGH|nr:alpha/beta hydrolase [Oceanicola granulosus]EAR50242.1 putative esterase [Oceanicola granulosus HTCC2516]
MADGNPWDGLTVEEHEFQFNPQAAFPGFADVRARLAPLNDAARATLGQPEEVAYGDGPLHRLDIFRAAGDGPRPVHVFYHGGYWRAQDKANYAFLAGVLVPLGITTVIANYDLCPAVTLDEVTASAVAGFGWVADHVEEIGGDAERITLSGHSAGAHLGAAILADAGLAEKPAGLRGAVLTSGIFDPRPAIGTSVNAELGLTEEIAARNDMQARPPRRRAEICLMAGTREPVHWVAQTWRYYEMLRREGHEPLLHLLAGHDHFDILEDYLRPDGLTLDVILRQSGLR